MNWLIVGGTFAFGCALPELLAILGHRERRIPAGLNWLCGVSAGLIAAGIFLK